MRPEKTVELFHEVEFGFEEKKKAMIAIMNVLAEYNLSHNQAVELLDCVKDELKHIPLWRK